MRHGYGDRAGRAVGQGVAGRDTVHGDGQLAAVPAVAVGIELFQGVGAVRGKPTARLCVQLHRVITGGLVGGGVHGRIGDHGHRDHGVVGAAEIVRHREGQVMITRASRARADRVAIRAGLDDPGSRPVGAVAIGTIYRGELGQVREQTWIEVDVPGAEEAIIGRPEVADLNGPGAVQLRSYKAVQGLYALVGAWRQGRSLTGIDHVRRGAQLGVVHPGAVAGGGAEAIGPAGAWYGIDVVVQVVGIAQEGASPSLLMEDHVLPRR